VAHRLLNPSRARGEGAAAARHAAGFDLRRTFERLAAETAAVVESRRRRSVMRVRRIDARPDDQQAGGWHSTVPRPAVHRVPRQRDDRQRQSR
jgi:hypothetical protein